MDHIKYPFFIEKNFVHAQAEEEIYNYSKCLGLGEKDGNRVKKKTKVFIFTFVCKGTSLCRASPCGVTSKRRFCGYGTRLYALNENPDEVIVEEFGRHIDDLGDEDLGYRLVPQEEERRKVTISFELNSLRSFARGLTPSKHVAYCGETSSLSTVYHPEGHDNDTSILTSRSAFEQIRLAYRRFRRLTHPARDIDGLKNVLEFLQAEEGYYVDHVNVNSYNDECPLVVLVALKEICCQCDDIGKHVVGLDATYGVTAYDFSLFSIIGRSHGGGIPLCYFISSSKSEWAITIGLYMFKRAMNIILLDFVSSTHGDIFALDTFTSYSPQAICVDKDDAERAAIATIFPSSTVILCHYHAMVIFLNEARALRHSLQEQVQLLMTLMRRISATTTINEFGNLLEKIDELSPSFYNYFSKNFLNSRWIDTFSEINRRHLPLSVIRLCRSNMLVEVSFKTLKYVIFGGIQNKRMDDLIYTLAFRAFPYFLIRHRGVQKCTPRFITSQSNLIQGTLLYKYVVERFVALDQAIDNMCITDIFIFIHELQVRSLAQDRRTASSRPICRWTKFICRILATRRKRLGTYMLLSGFYIQQKYM
tara:strand:+ start:174 stop:1946 length:1773 start_codon:yes stop_codon:yes gene_type:complete